MSGTRFIGFHYNFPKRKKNPSMLTRLNSGLDPVLQPTANEMKKVFDKFDINKDGKISQQEYISTLRSLGVGNMINDVPYIFAVVDLDGDGFINFEEFMLAQEKNGWVRRMDVKSAFRIFDRNGDGKISAEDVQKMLMRLGERCSLEECRGMVRAVDTNGDGVVDMDEFVAMMSQSLRMVD